MSILEYLQIPVFQKALLSSVIAGGTLSLLGIVITVFHLTTIRFALMHMALLGGAIGLIFGLSPLSGATVAIAIGSMLLGPLSQRMKLDPGLIGAFFMTGSIALAFLLFYKAGIPAMDVFGLFTGSILTLTNVDLWIISGLGIIIVAIFIIFYRELQFMFYDQEQAEWLGMPTNKLKNTLLFLTGLAIGAVMKVVGALLIDAIILLPAMTALRLSRNFLQLILLTSLFGTISVVGGLLVSMVVDLPVGATIALLGVIVLTLSMFIRR